MVRGLNFPEFPMSRMSSTYGTKSTASTAAAGMSCVRGVQLRWHDQSSGHREGFGNPHGGALAFLPFAPAAPTH
jgi:hypothetical protein